MYTELYKESLTKWYLNDSYNFNYAITYRPKKSKIHKGNAYNFFRKFMRNCLTVDTLIYTVESDWNGYSNHVHVALESKKLTKEVIAKAMKRNVSEIPYFEPIKDKESYITYINKNIGMGNLKVRDNNILIREQISEEIMMDNIHCMPTKYDKNKKESEDVNPTLKELWKHPNYDYHKRADLYMRVFSPNKFTNY
tara:strand:- start:18 stop:602 length:585 start_codon:yes stop_codon:yes gene_type:complete